ncbi:MAG: hypothetical protein EXR98_19360 [Gemmataceae bacterium]|nr:hypothetical protein [Gemmataceae bacterium]
MQQVLFRPFGIPIYGYGLMLFFAFIGCSWLARRMCKREGIDGKMIPDLAICLFITGIVGGRIVYVAQYWERNHFNVWFWNAWNDNAIVHVVSLWDGGLVLYGALFGGILGYFSFHHIMLRKQGVSHWKMLDVIAPCVALGIAFGRIGCLFTGCCYGNVACEACPAIHFPLPAGAWGEMVLRGHQSPFGFVMKGDTLEVLAVEPKSAADGIVEPGDVIVDIDGKEVRSQLDIWPTGGDLKLTVIRGGVETTLSPFTPTSIGVTPTQIFETISMCLLLFFLVSYYPYKRHDGELLVLFMFCYGVHRFLNEMLRTDTKPVLFDLTLSQTISLGVLTIAAVLAVVVWRRPLIGAPAGAPTP